MTPIGLDIGGANLKLSDGMQQTRSVPFALWKTPGQLADRLIEALREFPAAAPLAVTMTGELADCFETRDEGVRHILDSVEKAAAGRGVMVWQTVGEFVSLEEARDCPILIAAANWHALATWTGRMAPQGTSLLLDVGSTTTDIIPIEEGVPMPAGRTDLERLASGELQYLGVRRTPLCSLISEVPLQQQSIGLARELFATTLDVHLWRNEIAENPQDNNTANGKPATRTAAADRLARSICADRSDLSELDLDQIARSSFDRERQILMRGILQVISGRQHPGTVLLAGEGEFLARNAVNSLGSEWAPPEVLSLCAMLGNSHSTGACAFALARLASERVHS